MSREYTQKEIQEQFIAYIKGCINYWDRKVDNEYDTRYRLEGLAHSILCLLDGVVMGFPAYDIIPSPHPSDKEFHISEGEDYYRPFELPEGTITVHGGDYLHNLLYKQSTK